MKDKKGKKSAERVMTPYDQFVKFYLRESGTAKSLVCQCLPEKITTHIDFRTLKMVKDSFVDKKLVGYFADVLYEVMFCGRKAFIYLLIEHKSWEDKKVSFQLLKYKVNIWEFFLKQHKKAETLPVILPIVVYHGKAQWKSGNRFMSLFDAPESTHCYIPDFTFNLRDLSHLPDEEIKGDILLRILSLTLKYFGTPELRYKLPGIIRLFEEIKEKEKLTEYLEVLLRYLAGSKAGVTNEDLHVAVNVIESGGEIMKTIEEQLIEKGIEKGESRSTWNFVKNSIKEGLAISTIERITGLPMDRIKQMQEEILRSNNEPVEA